LKIDERTKQYLNERLERFKRLQNLRNVKEDFFPAINGFRQTTIPYLKKIEIVDHTHVDKLDKLLAEIDTYKTKGHGDEVYWSRVGPAFNKVILTIDELKGSMDEVKIPLRRSIKDFLSERSLLEKIVGGVIAALIVFLCYIHNILAFLNCYVSRATITVECQYR
jgi:hypothetical protein